MTQNLMECAYGGVWLMGAIALLILLLLAVCVATLVIEQGRIRESKP